jgi:hypothetical protein
MLCFSSTPDGSALQCLPEQQPIELDGQVACITVPVLAARRRHNPPLERALCRRRCHRCGDQREKRGADATNPEDRCSRLFSITWVPSTLQIGREPANFRDAGVEVFRGMWSASCGPSYGWGVARLPRQFYPRSLLLAEDDSTRVQTSVEAPLSGGVHGLNYGSSITGQKVEKSRYVNAFSLT